MPPAKKSSRNVRTDLIRSITTPLGFFVLALLIVEVTLGIVLSSSKLDAQHVWLGFLWMVGVFIGVVVLVGALTIFSPKNLLYGKEEYASPALETSALRDQVEDLIAQKVRPSCLMRETG